MKVSELVDNIASKFGGASRRGDGYIAPCPIHDDTNPSVTIGPGRDGKVLVYCHGGCKTSDVLDAVGLTFGDLRGAARITETYDYTDARGKLLYQVCRMEPKDFRVRRPVEGGWKWSILGVDLVPYNLKAIKEDKSSTVFVVEGEKDVEALRRVKVLATSNQGGAGKWISRYGDVLKGRNVVILPDNDEAGRKHAEKVALNLRGKAKSIKVVELPGLRLGGDASDWLADGGGRLKLHRLVKAVGEWKPEGGNYYDKDGTLPVPFAVLCKEHKSLREEIVSGLARAGETVNIIAPSKVGKSWLAWNLALSISNGTRWLNSMEVKGGRVLVVDNELHRETIAFRGKEVAGSMGLRVSGVDVAALRGKQVDYDNLEEQVINYVDLDRYVAVIVDSHYRMLPAGVSENDNAGVKGVYNHIDYMADRTGAAWFLVHHSTKGDQSTKDVTDVGAGAGSQSRATDSHLVLRKHVEDGAYVMEAAVRSFPPLNPLVLRWEFPVWSLAEDLDPRNLEDVRTKQQKKEDEKAKSAIMKIAGEGEVTLRILARNKLRMGEPRCKRLLEKLVEERRLVVREIKMFGNITKAYRVL